MNNQEILEILNDALDRQIRTYRGKKGYYYNSKKKFDDLMKKNQQVKNIVNEVFTKDV